MLPCNGAGRPRPKGRFAVTRAGHCCQKLRRCTKGLKTRKLESCWLQLRCIYKYEQLIMKAGASRFLGSGYFAKDDTYFPFLVNPSSLGI